MSDAPKSFVEVIGLWPSRFDMASDLNANPEAIRKWGERNSIPAEWWLAILATETAKSAGLSAEDLAALAADRAPVGRESIEVRA